MSVQKSYNNEPIQQSTAFQAPFSHIEDFSRRFNGLYELQDNVIYHPERTVQAHILTVVEKIHRYRWERQVEKQTMLCVAWLHDICKADDGEWKDNREGQSYWSNPRHPEMAAQLIHANDELQYEISVQGCDWRLVSDICRYHDTTKTLDITNPKAVYRFKSMIMDDEFPLLYNYLIVFRFFDDMINRYELPESCMSPFNKIDVN